MDSYIDRIIVMYQAILGYFDKYKLEISLKEPVQSAFQEFADNVAKISKLVEDYDDVTKGRTKAKKTAAEILITLMPPLCAALYNIGFKANDEVIKARVDIAPSKWSRLSEMELYNESKSVVDIAKTKLEGLAGFKYTPETINSIEEAVATYKSKLGRRELSQGEKKSMRKEIYSKVSENGLFMRKILDKCILTYKTDNPVMYGEYFAARTIKNLGVRHKKNKKNPGNTENNSGETGEQKPENN